MRRGGFKSWDRLFGRCVFCAGLVVWILWEASRLPFDFEDLFYLFSLEQGLWSVPEWVHPLYVPALHAYAAVLHWAGYSGKMLMPVEWLNLAVAALALVALFLLAESSGGLSTVSACGVLLLGFSEGFNSGCIRVTPYAMAVMCLTAFAWFILSSNPRRYIFCGVAAGAACGFHMAMISLIPVALIFAFNERGWPVRLRSGVEFLTSSLVVIAVSYALFMRLNHLSFGYFSHVRLRKLISQLEQVRRTSIWSSHSWGFQTAQFFGTLRLQGGPFLLLLLLFVPTAVAWTALHKKALPAKRLLALSMTVGVVLSIFFFINNTHNGLVFAALVLGAPAMAALVSPTPFLRFMFASTAIFFWSSALSLSAPWTQLLMRCS